MPDYLNKILNVCFPLFVGWTPITRIQKALLELYPEADKLSDFVRFLRLDGSLYDKPDKPKKIVHQVYKSDKVYTVGEIGPLLVQAYKPKEKVDKQTKPEVSIKPKSKPIKQEVYTLDSNRLIKVPGTWRDLEVKRLRDIEFLTSIGHFDSDKRKRAIYFYGLFVFRASGSFKDAAHAAHELNKSLKRPLATDVVENQLIDIKKNGIHYKYARETVVKDLEIDTLDDEQLANLQALIPTKVKRQRDYVKRRESRRNEKNLTQREAEKKELLDKVQALLQQGMNNKMIALEIGKSPGYVSKIVSQIKKNIN